MANEPNKHRSSVGHDGRSKAFAQPGEPTLAIHHDPNAPRVHDGMAERASGNIARAGKPKAFHPVSVHNGMTERQRDKLGMGHAIGSAPDASAANPLDTTVPGKTFTPAAPVIGHRSRINNDDLHGGLPGVNAARASAKGGNLDHRLGAAIMDEALNVADAATRNRYGRE